MSATALAAPTADALAREHPEFRGWLDLLAAAGEEAATGPWADAVPDAPAAGTPVVMPQPRGGEVVAASPRER